MLFANQIPGFLDYHPSHAVDSEDCQWRSNRCRPSHLQLNLKVNLTCHQCGTLLVLLRTNIPHYAWECPHHCLPAIDTGANTSESFDAFDGAEQGNVEFNATLFWPPLTQQRLLTAKVFMPHILYHFIECGRFPCYNSILTNVLVPHLDSVDVLDYVLKSPIVHPAGDVMAGKTGARIYAELRHRLNQVKSTKIRQYLADTFQLARGGQTPSCD